MINSKKMKHLMLATGLILLPLAQTVPSHAESFTPEQKKELEVMMKDFIMNNPEVLLESVQQHQIREEERAQLSAQEKLVDYKDTFGKGGPLPEAGNPDGDVTVVEFFDYNCGYCKKAYQDIMKVIESDDKVRVVFIDMPILSPTSKLMAEISVAAHKQGKYFEVHQALMDYRGPQSADKYYELAEKAGVDIEQLKKDMKSAEVQTRINKNMQMAADLNIRGTPGFVIGGKLYPGYIGMQRLKDGIEDARSSE